MLSSFVEQTSLQKEVVYTFAIHCLIDAIPSIHSLRKTIPLAYIIKFHVTFLSRYIIRCYESTHHFIKTHIGRTFDSWLIHDVYKVVAHFNPFQAAGMKSLPDFPR